MPIIDLQRRLREIGRIRMGEQVPTSNGKTRPAKLDNFRLTSKDRRVIDAAAQQWGGTVEPWQAPDGPQWQVKITATEIPVVVPPHDMAFSQWYEQWSAGGCQVRCDGVQDYVGEKPCHCDPEERECKMTTRLSLMLPDLPGMGLWRAESHGYYAAVELAGLVELAAGWTTAGRTIPARLRLEQRTVKRKGKTHRFAVPVLDLDVHPLALTAGPTANGELAARARPALTPVPSDVERTLTPSVRAQIDAVADPTARESRQTPLPATGIRPRTLAQLAGDQGPGGPSDSDAEDITNNTPATAGRANVDTPPGPANPDGQPTTDRTIQDVARKANLVFKTAYDAAPRGQKTKIVDRLRHALTWATTKAETASLKDLDPTGLARIWARLEDIAAGRITYRYDPDDLAGVTFISATGKETTVLWAEVEPDNATQEVTE